VAIGTGNISTIFQTINGNIYAAGMYKVDETRICDVTQDYYQLGLNAFMMSLFLLDDQDRHCFAVVDTSWKC
jgi:hypothetical protein